MNEKYREVEYSSYERIFVILFRVFVSQYLLCFSQSFFVTLEKMRAIAFYDRVDTAC